VAVVGRPPRNGFIQEEAGFRVVTTALEIAHDVDRMLSGAWDKGPVAALVTSPNTQVRMIPLQEEVLYSLRSAPPTRCFAACVSSLGHATDLGQRTNGRARIRITLAVTCCSTAVVIRHRDGSVVSATDVIDGELHDALRRFAKLAQCDTCGASAEQRWRVTALE
jgi:hypothetical protein